MKIYLVGGAVRDQLLELPVYDRDWVVVGATETEMLESGYRRADAIFPVFIHAESGEEYALARTEQKCGPGYKGFTVYAGPDVTLEQDLLRRDLTINALALDEDGNLVDVCDGRGDLDEGLLRHITPAFVEDPVRLLRVARFAAKLGQWGFRLAHGTHGLMKKMAASDDLLTLKPERIYAEMWKALAETQPWRFFEVLHRCGALRRLIPELAEVMGEQDSHQAGTDSMAALKRVARLSTDPAIRFAVAIFQAARLAPDVSLFISRLRVGKEAAARLKDLLELAPLMSDGSAPELLIQTIKRLKPERQPQRYADCELAGHALWPDSMPAVVRNMRLALAAMEQVDVSELQTQGLQGTELGAALQAKQLETLRKRLAAETC